MDIFSQEFKVPIKSKNKTQSTGLGSILSISVIIASLLYLIYLSYQYINGNLSPRVTQSTKMLDDKKFNFKYNPLLFSYDTLFKRYQQQTGFTGTKQEIIDKIDLTKNFQIFAYQYQYNEEAQENQIKGVPLDFCKREQYPQIAKEPNFYMCFDLEKEKDISLSSNSQGQDSSIFLVIGYCQMVETLYQFPEGYCHSKELQNLILSEQDFNFNVALVINNFNVDKEENSQILQRIKFYPDFENVAYIEFKLQETITYYDKNILFSSQEEVRGINNVDIIQHTMSNQYAYERFIDIYSQTEPGNLLALLELKINLEDRIVQIEYVKFSEVIAMYLGIFNTLMAIRILGKISSESVIQEELMENQLKHKYQLTAKQLQELNSKSKNLIKSPNSLLSVTNSTFLPLINSYKMAQKKKQDNKKVHTIKDSDQMNNDFNNNIDKSYIYNILQQEIDEEINILKIFEKLYQFEKMLKIIFNEEQLSAIQFCGQRIPQLLNPNLQNKNKNKQKNDQNELKDQINLKNKLNYLEKQYLNETSEEVIKLNFANFLKNIEENYDNASEIDKRIYNSLIQNKKNSKQINDSEVKDVLNNGNKQCNTQQNDNSFQQSETQNGIVFLEKSNTQLIKNSSNDNININNNNK